MHACVHVRSHENEPDTSTCISQPEYIQNEENETFEWDLIDNHQIIDSDDDNDIYVEEDKDEPSLSEEKIGMLKSIKN